MRWGTIYAADIHQLEVSHPDVHQHFMEGNFVVKPTHKAFNQVSTDMALEHVNKVGKVAGGLIVKHCQGQMVLDTQTVATFLMRPLSYLLWSQMTQSMHLMPRHRHLKDQKRQRRCSNAGGPTAKMFSVQYKHPRCEMSCN